MRSCSVPISRVVGAHVPAMMQLMCVKVGGFMTLGILASKCLNTAMMVIFVLTGIENMRRIAECNTNKVKRRRAAELQRTVNNGSSAPYWTAAAGLRDAVLGSDAPMLFYVMLTHNPLVQAQHARSNPTTYSDDEKADSEIGVMFPGHVFVIERTGHGSFNLFQSYIGRYTLKEHMSAHEDLFDMTRGDMSKLLDNIVRMMKRGVWTAKTSEFWRRFTKSDDGKRFEGHDVTERILLCFRPVSVGECAKNLEGVVAEALVDLEDKSRDGEVFGDPKLFDVDDAGQDFKVAPLTRGQMRGELAAVRAELGGVGDRNGRAGLVGGGEEDPVARVEDHAKRHKRTVVLVHSSGCGYCVAMIGAWRSATDAVRDKNNIDMFEIEAGKLMASEAPVARRIRDDPNFGSVPHIIALTPSGIQYYSGDRSVPSLVSFGCNRR